MHLFLLRINLLRENKSCSAYEWRAIWEETFRLLSDSPPNAADISDGGHQGSSPKLSSFFAAAAYLVAFLIYGTAPLRDLQPRYAGGEGTFYLHDAARSVFKVAFCVGSDHCVIEVKETQKPPKITFARLRSRWGMVERDVEISREGWKWWLQRRMFLCGFALEIMGFLDDADG